VDHYIKVADALEEALPDVVVEGNEELESPPAPGAFEVRTETGEVLFSKLKEGRLPTPDELLACVGAQRML